MDNQHLIEKTVNVFPCIQGELQVICTKVKMVTCIYVNDKSDLDASLQNVMDESKYNVLCNINISKIF